jgi:uncharacterized C2H2 Zn-finger protein
MYVDLPFVESTCSICAESGKGNFMALSLSDEINHITLAHKKSEIKFKCTKCGKIYKTKRGALCHMPKCTGANVMESTNILKCITCGKSFNSKVGLSQHQRHDHPLIRNAARKEKENRPKPKGFGQTWRKEEIELMHELEVRLRGERNIASKMCEFLPNKTNKQIRDKRNEKTYKEEITNKLGIIPSERTSVTEGGNGRNLTLQERDEAVGNQDELNQEWLDTSVVLSVDGVLGVSGVPGVGNVPGVSSVPGDSSDSRGLGVASVSNVPSVPGGASVSSFPGVSSAPSVQVFLELEAPLVFLTIKLRRARF